MRLDFRIRTRTAPCDSDSLFERKEYKQHAILGNYLPHYRYHCRHPWVWRSSGNGGGNSEDTILRVSRPIRGLAVDGAPLATGVTARLNPNAKWRIWLPYGELRSAVFVLSICDHAIGTSCSVTDSVR